MAQDLCCFKVHTFLKSPLDCAILCLRHFLLKCLKLDQLTRAGVTMFTLLTHKTGNISILASSISQKSVDKLPNKWCTRQARDIHSRNNNKIVAPKLWSCLDVSCVTTTKNLILCKSNWKLYCQAWVWSPKSDWHPKTLLPTSQSPNLGRQYSYNYEWVL